MSIPRAATSVVISTPTFLARNLATWIFLAVYCFGVFVFFGGLGVWVWVWVAVAVKFGLGEQAHRREGEPICIIRAAEGHSNDPKHRPTQPNQTNPPDPWRRTPQPPPAPPLPAAGAGSRRGGGWRQTRPWTGQRAASRAPARSGPPACHPGGLFIRFRGEVGWWGGGLGLEMRVLWVWVVDTAKNGAKQSSVK